MGILLTNNQQAEEYGQPTGLLFLLGLDACLHRKNGLGGWYCGGCWLDSHCCRVLGVIAVVISIIGFAAGRQEKKQKPFRETVE